ncbi:MAG: hypothetical protein WC414_00885 [Patescibacteria group bacterium]
MKMRIYPLKIYLITPVIAIFSAINLFFILLSFFWLIIQIPRNIGQVFLHYNILFGVDRIGSWGQIFILPLTGLLFFLLNEILAWFFYSKDKMISYFLNICSILLNIFVFVAVILTVFINT